jgi:hypothetical protein
MRYCTWIQPTTRLQNGLDELFFISIVLLVCLYVFAVLGMLAFRKNDPFHWDTLLTAFVTLFRCMTQEDWTDVMYINMYGCSNYPGGIYGEDGALTDDRCDPSQSTSQPVFSSIYFFIFILMTIVLMALFIGAISMGMDQAVDSMLQGDIEKKKELRRLRGQVTLYRQVAQNEVPSWFDFDTKKTPLDEINLKLQVSRLQVQSVQ